MFQKHLFHQKRQKSKSSRFTFGLMQSSHIKIKKKRKRKNCWENCTGLTDIWWTYEAVNLLNFEFRGMILLHYVGYTVKHYHCHINGLWTNENLPGLFFLLFVEGSFCSCALPPDNAILKGCCELGITASEGDAVQLWTNERGCGQDVRQGCKVRGFPLCTVD